MRYMKSMKNGHFTTVQYSTTWRYGYEFMLYYVQRLIFNDFDKNIGRIFYSELPKDPITNCKDELVKNNYDIRKCKALLIEHGMIGVAGYNKILNINTQFWLHNQTEIITIDVEGDIDDLQELNRYMNSLEILTYEDMTIDDFIKENSTLINSKSEGDK